MRSREGVSWYVASLFASATGLALFFYVLLTAHVLHKPLTSDDLFRMVDRKSGMAVHARSPKVLVLAGSNGRFSHSCETIATVMARDCVNLGVAASLESDFLVSWAAGYLKRGDILYVPLEYERWGSTRAAYLSDEMGLLLYRYDRPRLWRLGWDRYVHGAFGFDIRYFIESVGEMALSKLGYSRRVGVTSADINEHGDAVGHDDQAAGPYRQSMSSMGWRKPVMTVSNTTRDTYGRLVRELTSRGVLVVGGLPTTFDDVRFRPADSASWRAIFERNGGSFVSLPNLSQYPRADFFDSPYHLRSKTQKRHSAKVAERLNALLKTKGMVRAAPHAGV